MATNGNLVDRSYINGLDAYLEYGLVVQDKSVDFILPDNLKEPKTYNWPERSGLKVDLTTRQPEAKEISLRCFLIADTKAQLLTNRAKLMQLLRMPLLHSWKIVDKELIYYFFYRSSTNGKVETRRLEDVPFVLVSFDMNITANPQEVAVPDYRSVIYNTDGTVHTILEIGEGFTLPAEIVTPSITITGVNVTDNTVTINATATAGYDKLYSFNNGPYQSSNVFQGVSNNTYQGASIKARIVGTDITDSWESPVTVGYTPPTLQESVTITNVTPDPADGNKLIVAASTANTVKAVEYSLNGTDGWQSSHVLVAPNGTYNSITARLSGTTIIDVWDSPVTVNVVPPVPETIYNTSLLPNQNTAGVTFNGDANSKFMFNTPLPVNTRAYPCKLTIALNHVANPVGVVNFNSNAMGLACGIVYEGVTYHGEFANAMVIFK